MSDRYDDYLVAPPRDTLVRVGDIVQHPQYGVGLVVSLDECSRYYTRHSVGDARFVGTCVVMWDDGVVDAGWPVSRLASFVKTTRGLHI